MRALILGGHGAIGSAIARHADARGVETHVVARSDACIARLALHPRIARHGLDLADADSLRKLVSTLQPDWVVMAAFPASSPTESIQSMHAGLASMSGALLGVLAALAGAHYPGMVNWIGSALVYGRAGQSRDPASGLKPASWRGALKASESLLTQQFAAAHGLRLAELRVFTGYGPYEQPQRLVPSLMRAALTGSRVRLARAPGMRDWIHYDDIARACMASVDAPAGIFNLCTGSLADTRVVAGLVERITGMPLVAEDPWDGIDRYGDVEPGVLPDPALLPWSPSIQLAEGLRETWEWAKTAAGREWLSRES